MSAVHEPMSGASSEPALALGSLTSLGSQTQVREQKSNAHARDDGLPLATWAAQLRCAPPGRPDARQSFGTPRSDRAFDFDSRVLAGPRRGFARRRAVRA